LDIAVAIMHAVLISLFCLSLHCFTLQLLSMPCSSTRELNYIHTRIWSLTQMFLNADEAMSAYLGQSRRHAQLGIKTRSNTNLKLGTTFLKPSSILLDSSMRTRLQVLLWWLALVLLMIRMTPPTGTH